MSLNRFAQVQSFDELSPLQLAKLEQQMYAEGGSTSNLPSKQAQARQAGKAFMRGTKYMPQDLLGAPVDLINLGLTAIGKGSDKPVGGSDWLIDKSNQYFPSIVPKRTGEGYETAGRAAVALINPAGAVRTATKGVQKAAPHLAEAAYNAAQKNILGIPGTAPYQEMKLFVGENSANWNKSAAKEAEKLLKKGVEPEKVWEKTGVLRGLGDDRKLRREISDANSKILVGPKEATPDKQYKMSEVLDHPELYKSYPELKNTPVRYEKMGPGDSGYYDSDTGQIVLNKDIIPNETRGALLHEVQHKIQEKEKFRPGGNLTDVEEASRKHYAREGIDADDLDNFDDWFDAHTAYERLPGEAEARLVSERADLTPKQLKENYPHQPWTSEKQYGLDLDPDEIFDPRDFDKAGNQISFKKSPLAAPAIIKEPVSKKKGPLSREEKEILAMENAERIYGKSNADRRTRAQLMGFNTEDQWFHGSPRGTITGFDPAKATKYIGNSTPTEVAGATWITNNPEMANQFTGLRGAVYPLLKRKHRFYDPADHKNFNDIQGLYREAAKIGADPDEYLRLVGMTTPDNPFLPMYHTLESKATSLLPKPGPGQAYPTWDEKQKAIDRYLTSYLKDDLAIRDWNVIERGPLANMVKEKGLPGILVNETNKPGLESFVRPAGKGRPEEEIATQNIMLFDPTVLRSPNAVFDPALIDSANLMHAEGGSISS